MRVLIGRAFYYEKQDRIYKKGEICDVKNEFANWVVRNKLGSFIPVVVNKPEPAIKEIKSPPKDKMMRKIKTK